MLDFFSMSPETLKNWLIEKGQKPFHAKQIFEWVYGRGATDWEAMTDLSKALRQHLLQEISFGTLKQRRVTDSLDGETHKFLWELADGKLVESVLILSGERRTVCVSSQVGCNARCAFCASGRKGLFRNLTQGEIAEQVFRINEWLVAKEERVSHIVYMGMGEPMENYDNVLGSIRLLNDPSGLNIGQRRITVSTVGVVEGIERLSQEDLKINLVLSLHAPNQHIRKKIIPYARKYDLERVMDAMDGYSEATKRDITYEYILIDGINDKPEHAEELAKLVGKSHCSVNLIPYNPVVGLRLERPSTEAIHAFIRILEDAGVITTCRYTKGDDIAAACGQLALMEESA